jgi:mannosyl-3-phosphoglycerate phosphatase
VPLVLASSKTLAEMEAVASSLAGAAPLALIVENGGALVRRTPAGSQETIVLGAPHPALVATLVEIGREAGARLRGFSSVPPDELGRLTGLGPEEVHRCREREYDEPFLIEAGDLEAVRAGAERRGLRLHQGGRFLHLTGASDKGRALHVLLGRLAAEGRLFDTAGLGDAPNDRSFLQAVDEPILVPQADGRVDDLLAQALPRARRAPLPGPAGWNLAVLELLSRRGARAEEAVGRQAS